MKILSRRPTATLVLLLGLLWVPLLASAEWNVDLYGGGAFTQNSEVTQTSTLGVTLSTDLKVDLSFTVGGRAGVLV